MNRLVRTLVGVVVAKAAIVAGWYLYTKSTEAENDWEKEGKDIEVNKTSQSAKRDVVTKGDSESVAKKVDKVVNKVAVKKPATKRTASTVSKSTVKKTLEESNLEPKKVKEVITKVATKNGVPLKMKVTKPRVAKTVNKKVIKPTTKVVNKDVNKEVGK